MIASDRELRIQRKLTAYFINADPELISLTPNEIQSNGAGGVRKTPLPPRPPQGVHLVPLTSQVSERPTLDGKAVIPDFMLIGLHDMAIGRGDVFQARNSIFEVVHIHEKRDYETKAEAIRLREA